MKYIDADLLREKIEFWKSCLPTPDGFANKAKYEAMGARDSLDQVLYFIDSLPEQHVEGLEEKDFVEEVRQYYSNNCTWDALKQPMLSIITRCARHFAEWGAKHARKEDK